MAAIKLWANVSSLPFLNINNIWTAGVIRTHIIVNVQPAKQSERRGKRSLWSVLCTGILIARIFYLHTAYKVKQPAAILTWMRSVHTCKSGAYGYALSLLSKCFRLSSFHRAFLKYVISNWNEMKTFRDVTREWWILNWAKTLVSTGIDWVCSRCKQRIYTYVPIYSEVVER